jgi:nitrite reductase/ring-hydroxylating ferredoxin subunit
MADSRGGLASVARNGNSAARTYGAGIRPRSRDDGPLRAAGAGGARNRAGSKTGATAASGKTLAGATAHVASAAGADRSPSAGEGEAETGDADPDASDSAPDPRARNHPRARNDPRARNSSEGPLCAVRRAVLLGVVAGGAALVAGCGGEDGDSGTDAPGQAAQGSQPPSPSTGATDGSLEPFPGADDGDTGGGDAGGGLVKTSEVPVGGAVLVSNYLIAQPQRGVFKAFDATCPHQGITVDAPIGSNDYFICPGHNSKFRLADGGRISGPAPRGLKQVPVKVRNGFVVEA